MNASRIERFIAGLASQEVLGALILDPVNVGYLSGFTGTTAALIITREGPDRSLFITDSRYRIQAERECGAFAIAITRGSGAYGETIAEEVKKLGLPALAVEADYLTVAQYEQLMKKLEGVTLKPVEDLVGVLRRVKDPAEVGLIRQACAIVDHAFEYLLTLVKPGVPEREIAIELEYCMKKEGSEKEAFDSIVASGIRSALPHGRASDKLLEAGDLITFDFGARVQGYHSDLTRTVVLGKADDQQREVYQVVLDAQLAALYAIRAGVQGKAVDAVARDLIKEHGYGEQFGHGLGHGLGRDVHDHTALSPLSEVVLEAGMVLTVEPGVYLDGWGGVRIEDDVVVTESGCEILTHAPKNLIELSV